MISEFLTSSYCNCLTRDRMLNVVVLNDLPHLLLIFNIPSQTDHNDTISTEEKMSFRT